MDIFLSGDLKTFAPEIALSLLHDGHTVVVTGGGDAMQALRHKHFVAYEIPESDSLFSEIFTSHAFDTVLHFVKQNNPVTDTNAYAPSSNTSMLEAVLELSAKTGVEKFLLLSSIEVYGNTEVISESDQPQPANPAGQRFLNAERLCQFYANPDLSISILRLPQIYGASESYSIISNLIQASKHREKVEIPFRQHDHCNFLHVDDLNNLIRLVLEQEMHGETRVFNLGTEDINFDFLSQQLNLHFPGVKYIFPPEEKGKQPHRKIESSRTAKKLAWTPRHNLSDDLSHLVSVAGEIAKSRPAFWQRINAIADRFKPFLVWIEVLAGAFLMHMLTVWTKTIIEFKVIDYRLFFVVVIGSIHGLLFGLIAAILAAASAVFSWNSVGLDFALLIYNVENWIPFAVYFLAGAVTGYVHDKQENVLLFEEHQTELIHEKYTFLYSLYNEISTIKNRLRDQLVGYRDSFGRFFRITNELNEFEEDSIFLKALEILEELMKNDQIAIYSIEPAGNYCRLQVRSRMLSRKIPKSMCLDDYREALDVLKAGNVFQNKDLRANYPAFIAPIQNGSDLIGMVIIWEAKLEQFNLYYSNLFKVTTGLIQSALVRAATFENAQYEKLYLPGTRIMRPEPFAQALGIRKRMRRNKVSEFQLLKIPTAGLGWVPLFENLAKTIRGEDVVGILDDSASDCYVILANAALENIGMIQERIKDSGINSEHIQDLEIG